MTTPGMIILYADHPQRSAAFYQRLLEQAPVELSATFALFVLHNGFKLGIWSKHTVVPAAAAGGGGGELCFMCEQPQQVDALYNQWREMGLTIAQPPMALDFGYSFVAQDPDGHRLRVYTLSE